MTGLVESDGLDVVVVGGTNSTKTTATAPIGHTLRHTKTADHNFRPFFCSQA